MHVFIIQMRMVIGVNAIYRWLQGTRWCQVWDKGRATLGVPWSLQERRPQIDCRKVHKPGDLPGNVVWEWAVGVWELASMLSSWCSYSRYYVLCLIEGNLGSTVPVSLYIMLYGIKFWTSQFLWIGLLKYFAETIFTDQGFPLTTLILYWPTHPGSCS